jgi:hypothetical protein
MRAQMRRRHGDTMVLAVPGLKLWVRAESLAGLVNGTSVASWPDESGNGHDLTQAAAGQRPVFVAGVDGLPAVLFDGVDDVLATSGAVFNTDRHTIFVVLRPSGKGSNDVVGTGGIAPGDLLLMVPCNDRMSGSVYRSGQSAIENGAAFVHPRAFAVFEQETTGTDLILRLNGGVEAACGLSGTPAGVSKPVRLGSRNSTLYFQGYVRALLVFEGNPTIEEKERIRAFLISSYRIPMPYPPPPAPGAPQDLQAEDSGGGQVDLVWSGARYSAGASIERKPAGDPDAAFVVVGEAEGGSGEYYDEGVGSGAVAYRVRAFNASGWSPYSDTVTVTF